MDRRQLLTPRRLVGLGCLAIFLAAPAALGQTPPPAVTPPASAPSYSGHGSASAMAPPSGATRWCSWEPRSSFSSKL